MPKTSRDTASGSMMTDGLEVRLEHLEGGYSVCFESHIANADLGGLFRGLPETYEAADAYYVPPGHIPVHYAGAEIVEFSPTETLGETIQVVMRNLNAAGAEVRSTS